MEYSINIIVLSCQHPRRCLTVSIPDLQIRGMIPHYFTPPSTNSYVLGTQENRLVETVLLSAQNICLG